MIILRSWLQDYIDIPLSDDELIEELTSSGSLVDSYYHTLDSKIVIAEILEVAPHPNADKLRLAKVSDGLETYDVVCGAPNIAAGQKVPLAKLGAKIGEIEIAEATIRGQVSHGMLCSEHELGLGENHSGILILGSDAELGQPLSTLYESDLVMDLEITPNRGDCLSHFGMAREVAAILGKTISKQPLTLSMSGDNVNNHLTLNIKDQELCPRYFARIVKGVKIAPSPDWLQKRLQLAGVKPINNVVDITNYIMLDLGQPLHAFDASKIKDNTIVVRKAKKDETIITLDGENKTLASSMLVIADSEDPIAIAGVMGGYNSQIENNTQDIVIEAAEFNRISIRKTSKTLGLSTDASYRFERGIDPALMEYSINKAAKMVHEIAGGSILSGIAKVETPIKKTSVEYRASDINTLLGTDLNDESINTYLKHLGFVVSGNKAEVPSWRHDVTIWQDLAEEIVCLYGLKNVKLTPVSKTDAPKKSSYYYKEHLKDILVDTGYSEVYNYSFMSEQDINTAKIPAKDLLEVANPVSPENKYMRNSLVPGMLGSIAKNPTFDPVLLFEVGNVFDKTDESTHLCVVSAGSNAEKHINSAITAISKEIKLSKDESIVKCLKREELSSFKIKKPLVYYVEIDLTNIEKNIISDPSKMKLKLSKKDIIYRPVSKYPSLTRDLAFIVKKEIEVEDVAKSIYQVSELVNNVELFDEFASDKFGLGNKNIAYHIYLQAPDRTLNDDEANHLIKDIINKIEVEFKAKFRDK